MDQARGVAAQFGANSGGAYVADLTHPDQATDLIRRVIADGPLHAVVNNAGVYLPLQFAEVTDAVFEANRHKTFAINVESPIRIMRAATNHFRAHGGGKILNIASRVGFRGEPGAALYAASKAAIINLTRSLAIELAPHNVQVFGLAPGWVDTAMTREGMDDRLPEILATIPLGRMATPADCANAAAFLLKPESSYLSGVIIDINGASYYH